MTAPVDALPAMPDNRRPTIEGQAMADRDTLKDELATYRARFEELRANEGKFVLIRGQDVGGIFETYADALKIGYEKYQLEPFLVKKIAATEIAQFITRHITPCPA